jgi:hypothetical protein
MAQTNKYKTLFDTLDDGGLSDLRDKVLAEVESRRDGFPLERIKPGMSAEDRAALKAEINRVLRGE